MAIERLQANPVEESIRADVHGLFEACGALKATEAQTYAAHLAATVGGLRAA